MKKLYLIILCLLGTICPTQAQNYFNIYQENVVLKRIPTLEVDSITVTENSPHIIRLWQKGCVLVSYDSAEIDSIKVSNEDDPLTYLGIVGFNNELYKKDIDILATSTSDYYRSFVNNLPRKDGTLLYYAVDNALDMLNNKEITTPLSNVNLITFTDGLDQGSIMMNPRYSSSSSYLSAMSDLIRKGKYKGLPITAYSVGLRGNDVTDVTTFQNNLARLASSADKSFEVASIADLRTKFQDIANQIISISNRQTISLKIPGIDSGTRVRFVFDGSPAESSDLYIEGTFNLSDFTLRNIDYHGMKSRSGRMVQGTQDGIFVTFTFMGLQREDASQVIPTKNIKHYYKLPSSSTWQLNSEFTPDNNTQRTISHSGALIVLVLDCSGSLGSDFSAVKQYANEFIDMIANNAQPFSLKAPAYAKAELNEEKFNIVVSWDKVKHAESYQVYRSSSSSGNYVLVGDNVTTTSWTDNAPLSGYNSYRIKAVGHSLTSSYAQTSLNYSLDAPTNAKAVFDDANFNIKVSWNAVKYAESYQVYRSNSSSGSYTLVADKVASTSWIDNAPLAGSNYYRVKAIGHGLTSGNSNTTNVIDYKLETPSNVQAVLDEEFSNIVVSWNSVKHAELYQVYRCGTSNGSYILVVDKLASTSWTDNTPLAGNNYYRIKAMGHGLTSSYSNTTNVINYIFEAPTNVKVIWNDNDDVVVSWNAVKHAELYQVYRCSTSNGNYSLVGDKLTSTSWIDQNPFSGSNYYQIKAIGHGQTSYSNITSMFNYMLDYPTNAKAVWNENDDVVVSWDEVKHAEGYQVYRSSSSNGTYGLVANNITSTSWTDIAPLAGNNYYRVKAIGHGLISGYSDTTSGINYKLDAPTNASVVWNDNDDVVVTWTAVNHAEYYQVHRSSSSGGNYVLVGDNVTSISWTDNTPLSGYNYYRIKAVGHGLTSVDSNTTNGVDYKLDAPTNAKVVWNDNDDVMVSWDAVKHAECYQVSRNGTIVAENITSTSWIDKSPVAGDNNYQIKAVGHGLLGSESSIPFYYALGSPTNTNAKLNDDNLTIVVIWDTVKHAEGYQVFRSGSNNGDYTLVADNVTSTFWLDTSPLSGKNYYRIKAIGHGLTSRMTNPCTADISGSINGRDYVDLDLTSGTLWATCNVGATSPEDYGDYFAWGETKGFKSGKTNFVWSTYKWCKSTNTTLTKYCIKSDYGYNGFTDNKTELDPKDDAAYVNWGGEWRMPSQEQLNELKNQCSWKETSVNNVKGYLVEGRNGNSIFLPKTGQYGTSLTSLSYGYYWSRTLNSYRSDEASYLEFENYVNIYVDKYRDWGLCVRPVRNQ